MDIRKGNMIIICLSLILWHFLLIFAWILDFSMPVYQFCRECTNAEFREIIKTCKFCKF